MNFREWLTVSEMAARRSLARTMGKFQSPTDFGANSNQPNTQLNRPIAILTAFRKGFDLETNREANQKLVGRFKQFKLSHYPVIGAGQEEDDAGNVGLAEEESFVIQPIDENMGEDEFLDIVRELLFDPTGEGTTDHSQWGALVKLPSEERAFLLHHNEETPQGPQDYNAMDWQGPSARPRRGKEGVVQNRPVGPDPFYTQLTKGHPAQDSMRSVGEPEYGQDPEGEEIGRRFTISRGRYF